MWRTIGHNKAVDVLRRGLADGRTSHAYLIAGPRHVGKMTLATDLARALNCVGDDKPCGECTQCTRIDRDLHADVQVVGLGGGADGRARAAIGIDQVRDVQREASLKPFEGGYRVFIFDGAERLSEEAANCLLKTLEEPPDRVVLLLLVSDVRELLPTLVSRCQLLELRAVSPSLIADELVRRNGVDRAMADEVARLSGGRPGWAMEAAMTPEVLEKHSEGLATIENVVKGGLEARFAYAADLATSFVRSRDSGRRALELWLQWWRDVMLIGEGNSGLVTNLSRVETTKAVADALSRDQVVGAVKAVLDAIENLDRNASPRLALEHMMLALPRPDGS